MAAVLLLGIIPPEAGQAAIDQPITYLERDPTTGRFLVKYEVAGSAATVSSRDALTAPALSPDGTKIAFSGVVGDGSLGLFAVWTVGLNGTGLTQVTPGSYADLDPAWSPDGSSVAYSLNNTGSYSRTSCCKLARTVIGGATTALTANVGAARPDYSPDGGRIAYDTPTGVYTIPASGGGAKLIAIGGYDPNYSPDGSRVAYLQRIGSTFQVRTVPSAGGSATTIYSSQLTLESPVWVGDRVMVIEHSGSGYDGRTGVRIRSIPENGGTATIERTFPGKVAELGASKSDPPRFLVGDADDDGRDDLLAIAYGDRTVLNSTGSAFQPELWGTLSPETGWAMHLGGDFNRDGRTDTAGFRAGNGTWHVSTAGSGAFSTTVWADFSTASGWVSRVTGDFNGDGRADIAQFHPSNGSWWISRSTGSSFTTSLWADFSTPSGWTLQIVGDFDGDGRDDIANFHPSNGTWWVSRSTGTGFVTSLWADFSTPSGWEARLVGDFNGDGRDDIAQYHPSNGTWWVSRSTGTGFVTSLWADFSTSTGWVSRVVGDFNGDGRDDIAQFHPSNGTWWVSRSTGSSFATLPWADFSTPSGWQPQLVGDFNGDGRDDIANYFPGNATWWVSRSTGSGFTTTLWASP